MRSLSRAVLLAATVAAGVAAPAAQAAPGCAGAPDRACLLPFPNDAALTRPDRSTPTGRRLALRRAAMPANAQGVRIDPAEYNRSDGFSPGQPIIARIPRLGSDRAFEKSRIVPVGDLGQYRRRDQPVLLLDARTGRRQPIWAELDANATRRRLLLVNPARNLAYGRRYVVVLRNLRTAAGGRIGRVPGFTTPRRLRRTLRRAHVRDDRRLHLAWDFTVASRRSITGRALAIRDDAFRRLGDADLADGRIAGRAPGYAITKVTDYTPAENPQIARKVEGTVTVPCYLTTAGCAPGGRFRYRSSRPDALPAPAPGNVARAAFACNVPRAATPGAPARVSLYGHGLLGTIGELDARNVRDFSAEHDITFCATPWAGFARADVPTAAAALADLSKFPAVPDGSQQGFVNALYLGRLLAHPQGLAADPALQAGGRPVIDPSALYYDGNSQGGILGGALMALSPDATRGVLGVPGMRFSTLLPRSSDFDTYRLIFDPAYPDPSTRTVALSLLQLLWDRGEANGYARAMTTRPLPGTPEHTVLMQVAVADHQVSTVTADAEARTIGARRTPHELDPGRSPDRRPLYGIPALRAFPFKGSAIVYWDSGTPLQPQANTPPRLGPDPHEDPRATPAARAQKSAFMRPHGAVIDVCGARPCRTAAYRGASR